MISKGKQNCLRGRGGFTLIELMYCVAIIGILASIAIPQYTGFRAAGQMAEAFTLARNIQVGVGDYYGHTGFFPKDNAAAGVPGPEELMGLGIEKVEIEDGALHMIFQKGYINASFIDDDSKDKEVQAILSLRPAISSAIHIASPISWLCGYVEPPVTLRSYGSNRTNINPKILPLTCK